ncbi:MAG: hypothetical protein E6H55_13270, partial [Betaproteobacteria bacterium]
DQPIAERRPRMVCDGFRDEIGADLPVVMKVKEAINRAYESSLAEGLLFERREFHATFVLDDQKEGMRAFVDKRKPEFKHR